MCGDELPYKPGEDSALYSHDVKQPISFPRHLRPGFEIMSAPNEGRMERRKAHPG